MRADGVCELREPAVLSCGHECGPRVTVGWCFFEFVEVAAEESASVVAWRE